MVSSPRSSEQLGCSNLADLYQAPNPLSLRRLVDAGAFIRRRRGGEGALSDFLGMNSDQLWKRLWNFSWEGASISVREAKKIKKLLQDLSRKKGRPRGESGINTQGG